MCKLSQTSNNCTDTKTGEDVNATDRRNLGISQKFQRQHWKHCCNIQKNNGRSGISAPINKTRMCNTEEEGGNKHRKIWKVNKRTLHRSSKKKNGTGDLMGVQQTSIDTFRDITESLGGRRLQVYNNIKYLEQLVEPPTNLEISHYADLPINQVTPRTNELVKMGLVQEHKKRTCSISGRVAMTWRIK